MFVVLSEIDLPYFADDSTGLPLWRLVTTIMKLASLSFRS